MPTFRAAVSGAARRFREAGLDTPDLDARLLVAEAADLDTGRLIAALREAMATCVEERLETLIARRLAGEPVARILGRREFWSREFALSPATLVPRPDSEMLIEAVLAAVPRTDRLRIVDLGTGSGCLLVTLLCELPRAIGAGVDMCPEALATARANAVRHGVAERALFVRGSWADALAPGVDVAVVNPPYVTSGEIASLAPEVARFEPVSALDGGTDGLDAYRALMPSLMRVMVPRGVAAIELGARQAEAVRSLARAAGFEVVAIKPDLAGTARALVVRSPS